MCFFSGPKQAALPPPPPPPSPAPLPTPADTAPTQTQDQKRLQIANLKKGFASTIVNAGGPQGTTGKGPDLNTPVAGGLYPSMGKGTLGA